jgi:hypothetical protein
MKTYTASERQLPSNLTELRREHSFGKLWVQIWDQKAVKADSHTASRAHAVPLRV